jgi:two-component system, LytTR family, sensor kinase
MRFDWTGTGSPRADGAVRESVPGVDERVPLTRLLIVGGVVWGALVWGTLCAISLSQLLASEAARGIPMSWPALLAMHVPPYLFYWLLTPVVFAMVERHGSDGTPFLVVVSYAAAVLAVACIPTGLTILASAPYLPPRPRGLWGEFLALLGLRYGFDLATCLAVVAVATGFRSMRRARRHEERSHTLEKELLETRFQALTAQLHPHFLFNALNGVAMLIRGRAYDQALRAVIGYGELLRAVLDDQTSEVPLAHELAFMRRYLEIEEMRFPGSLDVRIEASEDVEQALVPRLLLQPIIENALRHGVGDGGSEGRIQVRAERRDARVHIEISDNGAGLPPGWDGASASGVGIRNTRRRLAHRFGEQHVLRLTRSTGGGTTVVIELPLRVRQPAG